MATLTNNELDGLRREEAYEAWTGSLEKEEEMKEEGRDSTANNSSAIMQIS